MSQEQPEMSSDGYSGSPFAGEPQTDCPFAAEPEEPKLSILHLMVWAACVAVYMSAYKTVMAETIEEYFVGGEAFLFAMWGVAGGSYLAGILLLVVRRIHGQRFPRSGGEMLWLLGAISTLQMLIVYLIMALFMQSFTVYSVFMLIVGVFVWLPAYLYAILRSRGYWRLFFLLLAAIGLGWYFIQNSLLGAIGIQALYIVCLCRTVFSTALISVVALLDFRRRDRTYPWPHWVGILLAISDRGFWAVIYIVLLCRNELP